MVASRANWSRLVAAIGCPSAVADRPALVQHAVEIGGALSADSVGCSVTEAAARSFRTPASSNPIALSLDQVQYAADDGPCVAATRDGYAHSILSMGEESEYPEFTAAALRVGVRSSLSLPLTGADRPAALNLYAGSPDAFSAPRERGAADLLARCVAMLLSTSGGGGSATTQAAPDPDLVDAALSRRALVRLAQTAAAARDGVSQDEAFDQILRRSRTEVRSIFAICTDILADQRDRP